MKRIVLLCVFLAIGLSRFAPARDTEGSWDKVMSLTPGCRVELVTQKMKSYTGEVAFVNEAALALSVDGVSKTFARPEVFRVSLREKNRRARNALIGAAIGAGAGFAAGAAFGARYGESSERGEPSGWVFFGTLGCLPGAGVGALVGALLPVNPTLYRAERATARGERRSAEADRWEKEPKDVKDQKGPKDGWRAEDEGATAH